MVFISGLLIAWSAYVLAFAAWFAIFFGQQAGLAHPLLRLLAGGGFFGFVFVVILAIGFGPLLWAAVRRYQIRTTRVGAVLMGLAVTPVHVTLMWLLMRDENETFAGLFGSWRRLPSGEWAAYGWPVFIGIVAFVMWTTARRSSSRTATV